jgi:RTA1 like protein
LRDHAYAIRYTAILNPTSKGAYDPQFILILLAPLWINAFDHMLLGRMMHFFLPETELFGICAQRMGLCFGLLDISFVVPGSSLLELGANSPNRSFTIQLCGAVLRVSTNTQIEQTVLHVYTGGVVLQQFFILCFISLASIFHRLFLKASNVSYKLDGKKLLYVLYTSLGLIIVRPPLSPPYDPI